LVKGGYHADHDMVLILGHATMLVSGQEMVLKKKGLHKDHKVDPTAADASWIKTYISYILESQSFAPYSSIGTSCTLFEKLSKSPILASTDRTSRWPCRELCRIRTTVLWSTV
jgi:hypothetical protein